MTNPFTPAVKSQLKARVAFDGPTGSGKTWTALSWATVLAEGGSIAFIDTERDSARLYANHFTFDVLRFDPPYEVARLVELLKAAEDNGYAVVVVDSLSHFWEGEGGVLDEVDAAANRSFNGSSFAGWKHGTPLQRHMVDTFLSLDMHVIVCMRSKMEYVLVDYIDKSGQKKTKPEKVGMAPVQRGGLEYEFTIVGDMDLEHRITFSKSRCDVLGKTTVQPDREREAAQTFLDWLNDGEPPPPKASPDAVREHVAAVKSAPEDVKTAMGEWMGERGYALARLTEPQLDEANEHLASLLGAIQRSDAEDAMEDATATGSEVDGEDEGREAEPGSGSPDATELVPSSSPVDTADLAAFSPEPF